MRQLEELREERAALFSMGGFPADYMEMDYTCPQCRDTGYVNGRKCRCFRQAEIRLLYGQSNLEEVLKRENFSAFTFDYYDKDLIVNEKKQISQYDYMKAVAEECRAALGQMAEAAKISVNLSGDNAEVAVAPEAASTELSPAVRMVPDLPTYWSRYSCVMASVPTPSVS